ncbi:hypothetical protein B0H16DRAFT_1692582 [Mycena metata]|uniref:Uncharacterized protein n=1 Tax=Mycena metata TaxID=1033252 RepID=A0AAD7INC2_9AGAR|nr:hypothetical protein B0H16DRAFT_1692582 [Mycena metata]
MLGLGLREGKARDTTLESEQVANTFGWIQRVISASCGCSHDNATKRSAALDTTGTPGYSCDCQCSPVLSALRISAIGGMSKRRKILREGWPGRRRLEGNQAKVSAKSTQMALTDFSTQARKRRNRGLCILTAKKLRATTLMLRSSLWATSNSKSRAEVGARRGGKRGVSGWQRDQPIDVLNRRSRTYDAFASLLGLQVGSENQERTFRLGAGVKHGAPEHLKPTVQT